MSILSSNKSGLMEVVRQFLTEDDWNFRQVEGKPLLQLGFTGENGRWQCFAQVSEEMEQLAFYSMLDVKVPQDKRLNVAEFLTRANYGLNIGNFEMDFSDGEIKYKTSVSVKGGQLTNEMIKVLVYANVMTVDKYFAGIMSVIYGGQSPVEAIQKAES